MPLGDVMGNFYKIMGNDTPNIFNILSVPYFGADPYSADDNDLANLKYSTLIDFPPMTDPSLNSLFSEQFKPRVESRNPVVINKAAYLATSFPGTRTIGQVCYIYEQLKYGNETLNKWAYVSDPVGFEYHRYANETLLLGESKLRSGYGDCDDFAILTSAMIESIGGYTRIVLAYNNSDDQRSSGHAYSEVYLGKLGEPDQNAEKVILWPMLKYSDEVYCHLNTTTNEVWLNLDWGKDENGVAHPGAPFISRTHHTVVYTTSALKPPVGLNPQKPEELTWGDIITSSEWANQTRDLNEIMTISRLLSSSLNTSSSPAGVVQNNGANPLDGLMGSILGSA